MNAKNYNTEVFCPLCGKKVSIVIVEYPDYDETCSGCSAKIRIWASPDGTLNVFGIWDRSGKAEINQYQEFCPSETEPGPF